MTTGKQDAFVEFVRSRPPIIQQMMLDRPPLAVVKARSGITLLVPAPGVEGTVVGYVGNGLLIVQAPITIPHPEHGWGTATPGELANARVHPVYLELVRESQWTRADVEAALA